MKAILFFLILMLSGSCMLHPKDTVHPNIILVMSEDQGWGQTGYNNHPVLQTPNLDAMSANGVPGHPGHQLLKQS